MNIRLLSWKKKVTPPNLEDTESSSAESSQTSAESSETPKRGRHKKVPAQVPVSQWFVTFMCMNIPVIGWLYLMILAFSPSKGPRRDFAKAYILYKLVFLLLTVAILAVAIHYGLEVLDKVLAYMEML